MSTKKNARLRKAEAKVPMGWVPPNLLAMKKDLRRKVVFDLHGPILDWSGAFLAFCSELYSVKLDPKKASFYCPSYDSKMPITPQEFGDAFKHFARKARGGYGDLKPQAGIASALKRIAAADIAIEIWTWVPSATDYDPNTLISNGSGIAQDVTRKLLEKHNLVPDPYKQVRFIKPDQKISNMVSEHIPLIIEDHPVTAIKAGTEYGHGAILVPEPYNQHVTAPGVLRLDNREDLATAVIDFFDQLNKAGCLGLKA